MTGGGTRAFAGVTARPAGGRPRYLVAIAAAVLALAALTGCRGVGPARGSAGAADGAAPGTTQQPAVGAVPGGEGPTGTGSAGGGSADGGSSAADLAAVDRDLAALASADAAVGSDLSSAAAEAAQPDNG